MDTLRKDFLRFSLLHSWYKRIPLEGSDFYLYQEIGEQARNGINAEITDPYGIHWHFSRVNKDNQPECKVRFGPFLRGIYESENLGKCVFDFGIIMKDSKDSFLPWIATHYPEWASISFDEWEQKHHDWKDPIVIELFEREKEKYWLNVLESVQDIVGSVRKESC